MHSHPQDGEGDVVPEGIPPVPQGEEWNVVPEDVPPVPKGEEWGAISKDVHRGAQFEARNPHDAEDDSQDGLLKAWTNRDQFDPGRGASRSTLVKGIRRKIAANNRRYRARRALLPLLDFSGLGGGHSGEYEVLNREWRDSVALAGRNTYEHPEVSAEVRKVVVLTLVGEAQVTIAARLGLTRANNVATMISRFRDSFRDRFEVEMGRESLGDRIRLDGLYCCCATANRDHGTLLDVSEFRKDDPIGVGFERVSRDVDRILELIAADESIPRFVQDVVVNRLEAISEIASSHFGADLVELQSAGTERNIVRDAMCLVLLPFPSLAQVPSLAKLAEHIGIDVTEV
jgi:DNA-directed RNA polymerase specialized sigma24 family protein